MNRRRWLSSLSLAALLAGTAGVWLWLGLRPSVERSTFRVLEADVFHPTFYTRFAAAREQHLPWVTDPLAVAFEFVGRTRNCPSQRLEVLSGSTDTTVVLVTRTCPYSNLATQRQFRVDLVRRDAAWEVGWAGQRYRCATNQNGLAVFLTSHSPFRGVQASWAHRVTGTIDTLADSLNPWLTDCP